MKERVELRTAIAIIFAVLILATGFVWYKFEAGNSFASNPLISTSASSSSIVLEVNGKKVASTTVVVGSNFDLTWMGMNVRRCLSGGEYKWADNTSFPISGNATETELQDTDIFYSVICTDPSGNVVSDTVAIYASYMIQETSPNITIADPHIVPSSAKNILLNSFTIHSGQDSVYLTSFDLGESQDIFSGSLPIDPFSVNAEVSIVGSSTKASFVNNEWADNSATGEHGGVDDQYYPTLSGTIWIPPNTTTTINIFGDIANAQPGTYVTPFTIGNLRGTEKLNEAQDNYFSLGDPEVSGQDIEIN